MNTPTTFTDSAWHNITTAATYAAVALIIALGWIYADLDLYRAQDGLGYWFGIIGSSLMALLLLYPLRKRARFMRNAGPVRYWFRTHMIFGIAGPVLIIFHSNYELGSINSRVAFFCTIIVSASGIIGRYLYAKLHYGLYGHRASLVGLRKDLNQFKTTQDGVAKLVPVIHDELNAWEDEVLARNPGPLASLWFAIYVSLTSRVRYYQTWRLAKKLVRQSLSDKGLNPDHIHRLQRATRKYLDRRVSLLRKFAQYQAAERLFSLWHIVHYPLFILLVLAAIVHIVAVHMY